MAEHRARRRDSDDIEFRAGMAGSVHDLLRHPRLNHRPEVVGGLMAEDCAELLKRFFQSRRLAL